MSFSENFEYFELSSSNTGQATVYEDPSGVTACVLVTTDMSNVFEYLSEPSHLMKLTPTVVCFVAKENSGPVPNDGPAASSFTLHVTFKPHSFFWWKAYETRTVSFVVDPTNWTVSMSFIGKYGERNSNTFHLEREGGACMIVSKVVQANHAKTTAESSLHPTQRPVHSVTTWSECLCCLKWKNRVQWEQLQLLNSLRDAIMQDYDSNESLLHGATASSTTALFSASARSVFNTNSNSIPKNTCTDVEVPEIVGNFKTISTLSSSDSVVTL